MSNRYFWDPSGIPPAPRSEWWRPYLALQSRRIAMNRMQWFAVFGVVVVLVAAVFLVPMLLAG